MVLLAVPRASRRRRLVLSVRVRARVRTRARVRARVRRRLRLRVRVTCSPCPVPPSRRCAPFGPTRARLPRWAAARARPAAVSLESASACASDSSSCAPFSTSFATISGRPLTALIAPRQPPGSAPACAPAALSDVTPPSSSASLPTTSHASCGAGGRTNAAWSLSGGEPTPAGAGEAALGAGCLSGGPSSQISDTQGVTQHATSKRTTSRRIADAVLAKTPRPVAPRLMRRDPCGRGGGEEVCRRTNERTRADGRVARREHPELLVGFADEGRAARFNSSLVGFTTFQSQAVLNGMLRAAPPPASRSGGALRAACQGKPPQPPGTAPPLTTANPRPPPPPLTRAAPAPHPCVQAKGVGVAPPAAESKMPRTKR